MTIDAKNVLRLNMPQWQGRDRPACRLGAKVRNPKERRSPQNALPVYDQRVAALHNEHVFVIIVNVFQGRRILTASPECHLAPVYSVQIGQRRARVPRCVGQVPNKCGDIKSGVTATPTDT